MLRSTLLLSTALAALSMAAYANTPEAAKKPNSYGITHFVANKPSYNPTLNVEPEMVNAWGISIRPKGAGGHFWVTAGKYSFEYVGDVKDSPSELLRSIHQDELKVITLPVGGDDKLATGTVFSNSTKAFTITQKVPGAADITAPAKFLFSSDGGIISAWTERKKPDGTFDRALEALTVIDQSREGAQFFGLAINTDNDTLYAADFGKHPGVKVFDGKFKPTKVKFDTPFDTNKNGKVDPGEYAPFGIQALNTASGRDHIFVAYAKTMACPAEEVTKGTCKAGELFAGEEDISKPGNGKLAEFTERGKLIAVWRDEGKLSAPWGLAYAPANFCAHSGDLLVSNFGDGTIAAYDAKHHGFKDVLRDNKGHPIAIDKIWGILFGNGESLGDSNALYFAAGPVDETDGVFGVIRQVPPAPAEEPKKE